MNYIDEIAQKIGKKCSIRTEGRDGELLRFYALLVLTTGINTTNQNIHDAWSAWQSSDKPDHKSLVPFNSLSRTVQDLDEPYRKAIIDVTKSL